MRFYCTARRLELLPFFSHIYAAITRPDMMPDKNVGFHLRRPSNGFRLGTVRVVGHRRLFIGLHIPFALHSHRWSIWLFATEVVLKPRKPQIRTSLQGHRYRSEFRTRNINFHNFLFATSKTDGRNGWHIFRLLRN